MDEPFSEPIRLPIDGTLDLHHFSPKELKYLIPDYLVECRAHEIYLVKIIHGKGKGVLRRTVHHILESNSMVKSFKLASYHNGSWGATIVDLKKK